VVDGLCLVIEKSACVIDFFFMGLGIGMSRLHLAAMSSSCNIFESKENEGEKTSKIRCALWVEVVYLER
jgi:hypothetical protein